MDGMANLVEEIKKNGDENLGGVPLNKEMIETVSTLTREGEWPEIEKNIENFFNDPEFLLLAIRSNPGNIGFIPGEKVTPEMVQAALESPKDRFDAINEARDEYGLQKLQEAEYFQSAGPHARVESPAEAFNEIVAPVIQKTGVSPEVLDAIKTAITGSQGTPEDLLKTARRVFNQGQQETARNHLNTARVVSAALEKFENLKNQVEAANKPDAPPTETSAEETANDFGQAMADTQKFGEGGDDNQSPPDYEPAETEQPTETTPSHSGSGDPPKKTSAKPPGPEAPPAPGNPIGAPNINYVVDTAENPPSKPSTAAGPTNPDPSSAGSPETNETSNPTPEQPQASTENEATKKEPEPLPDCPEGASDWLRGLHSALGDLKETHDVRLAQDRAKHGLTKQEQKKLEDEEEAKRQSQGGGGGGRSFLSFNRQNSSQKQDRRSSRKEELAQINDRLVQKSLRNTFTLSSQVEADRLALGEKMQVLNATLSNDPEAQKFLSKVDDFAAAKGMTRGDVFDKMHAGEMPSFAESARELAQRPDLRPLFADADALAGNLAKNTNSLCESLDSLKKKGVDVSHLKDHFEKMENGIQDARIPDPASKQRLDKLNKAMQEQMKKIMEAITKLVQKVLNSIRGRFGG